MKVLAHKPDLIVVQLDQEKAQAFKTLVHTGEIPEILRIYEDRLEIDVRTNANRKKTKKFSYTDLLIMNAAIKYIANAPMGGRILI